MPRLGQVGQNRKAEGLPPEVITLIGLRLQRGLSQEKLAWDIGVDPRTVCFWEQGRTRPGKLNLARWRKALEGSGS